MAKRRHAEQWEELIPRGHWHMHVYYYYCLKRALAGSLLFRSLHSGHAEYTFRIYLEEMYGGLPYKPIGN
jgi:hypothetical protein